MKKFIRRFLSFVSIILILLLITDFWLTSKLKDTQGPEGEIALWRDIYSGMIDADIAIYGSSRAWVHFDPIILEDSLQLSAYNFGIDGHNFWLQYLRHLKYIEHNELPQTILLSVDVFSFAKRKDLYLSEQFLPFMLWDNDMHSYTKSYEGFSFIDYYIPAIRYVGKRKLLNEVSAEKTDTSFRILGYRGVNKKWNKDFEKAQQSNPDFRLEIDEPSINLFKQFIQECKSKGIQLILVYAPEHVDGQNFVKNRSEIFAKIQKLSHQYQLEFLDYSNISINNKKEYFYNASHLNRKGAELFTRQLSSDLKTLVKINEQ